MTFCGDDRAMNTLDGLPVELKMSVLEQIPDISSIRSLALASSRYYTVCSQHMFNLLLRQYNGEVEISEALVALHSEGVIAEDPRNRDKIIELLDCRRRGTREGKKYKHDSFSIDEIIKLFKLHKAAIYLMDDFSTRIEEPPWWKPAGHPTWKSLDLKFSHTERARFFRAFYRLQTWHCIFGEPECFSFSLALRIETPYRPSYNEWEDMTFSHEEAWRLICGSIPPWDVEEMLCLFQYMKQRYIRIYREILAVLLHLDRDSASSSPLESSYLASSLGAAFENTCKRRANNLREVLAARLHEVSGLKMEAKLPLLSPADRYERDDIAEVLQRWGEGKPLHRDLWRQNALPHVFRALLVSVPPSASIKWPIPTQYEHATLSEVIFYASLILSRVILHILFTYQMSKILTVFGATGNQGGSIANYVIADPVLSKEYSVRAVTRNTEQLAAKALSAKGIEVVEGDLDDVASIQTALRDAHTVFATTATIYDGRTKEREVRQGRSVADAAVAAGVKYLIWSTLSAPTIESKGKYARVDSFDCKYEVEQYIRSLPIKSAFFAPASFMQNFSTNMAPHHMSDGTFAVANILRPESKLPLIDTENDTGKYVGAILAEPEKFKGQILSAATNFYSMEEIVQTMSRVSGKMVKYNQIPVEVFEGFLPPEAADCLIEMLLYIEEFGYYGNIRNQTKAERERLIVIPLAQLAESGHDRTSWNPATKRAIFTPASFRLYANILILCTTLVFIKMVSALKLVSPHAKDIDIPTSSWPANLTVNHPAATSIVYPDVNTEHGRFEITHMVALHSSNQIVPKWDGVAEKTIFKLQKMDLDWGAVECFECKGRRGKVPSTETTLFITVYDMPPITMPLVTFLVEIYDIARCRVEMRAADVGRYAGTVTRKYKEQAYLSPGSRISFGEGLKTPVEGTIGGIVELYDDSGVHRDTCALTCHSYLPSHNVTPDTNMNIGPGPQQHPLQNYGIIRCAYPSEIVWQDWFEQVSDDLRCVNRQIKEIEEEMNTREEHADKMLDSLRTHLADLKSQNEQLDQTLERITSADCSIGTVCAFSGNRVIQNHHLDWALIALDEDTQACLKDANTIPNVVPWAFGKIRSPDRLDYLRPGLTVFKAQYPDFTGGTVNATKSYVRFRAGGEGDQTIETTE
ncbi:hypothetical protein UA08_08087 [Talaromyces atroroseus]|uniref:NmrA-like domain-containing protein n=1 Tax=Talaromyces atroroseus TaxID=1441469 RepID=A0A225AHL1_TALAT|nr:hypothetical protein UA08_08087 [Talaromyces atroroseus]OKL56558.1 hypothetical protein UA08_08087 [Talaromyces atroroseus]